MDIGILGGSFNPAHKGHLDLSNAALQKIGLQEVWWLVTPCNPFKQGQKMLDFTQRLQLAEKEAKHLKIKVKDYEKDFKHHQTYFVLSELMRKFPQHRFVWLMGADNLDHFDKWDNWQAIMKMVNIAIFTRGDFFKKNLNCQMISKYRKYRLDSVQSEFLLTKEPPHWCYIPMRPNPISATEIRAKKYPNLN